MSRAELARHELLKAKNRGGYIPKSNPYYIAPAWMPYPLAFLLHWMIKPDASAKRHQRRKQRRP